MSPISKLVKERFGSDDIEGAQSIAQIAAEAKVDLKRAREVVEAMVKSGTAIKGRGRVTVDGKLSRLMPVYRLLPAKAKKK